MNRETLLTNLITTWETFWQTLEGIPHEDLEQPVIPGGWSVKEICAFLTAWDGEALRRIDFITGDRPGQPHDPYDTAYWNVWAQNQVETKSIMSVQGILVDMVGARQRLISRLTGLNDFYFERWLAEDPQATQSYFSQYLQQVQTWRDKWEQTQPPTKGLKKLWWTLQNRFKGKFLLFLGLLGG